MREASPSHQPSQVAITLSHSSAQGECLIPAYTYSLVLEGRHHVQGWALRIICSVAHRAEHGIVPERPVHEQQLVISS